MNSFWLNVFKVANKFLIFAIVFLCISSSSKSLGFAEECIHANVTFGRPIRGQTLVNDTIICEKGSFFGTDVSFKYPGYRYIKYSPWFKYYKYNVDISEVIVLNLHKGCDCGKETFKIKSGGIGKANIELEVSALGFFCPNCHRFLVYNNTRSMRTFQFDMSFFE